MVARLGAHPVEPEMALTILFRDLVLAKDDEPAVSMAVEMVDTNAVQASFSVVGAASDTQVTMSLEQGNDGENWRPNGPSTQTRGDEFAFLSRWDHVCTKFVRLRCEIAASTGVAIITANINTTKT